MHLPEFSFFAASSVLFLSTVLVPLPQSSARQIHNSVSTKCHKSDTGVRGLQLIDLPPELVSKHQAYCLDGSPYKYYFRPSMFPEEHGNDYALYFQGGGWCYDEDLCRQRAKTNLGSSTNWQPTIDNPPTLIDGTAEHNPLFFAYNHIYLPYCDGASFSGSREHNATQPDALWYRGKHILDAALEHLGFLASQSTTMVRAVENFLITGCSAGGLSVYLHADYIREQLLLSNAAVGVDVEAVRVKAVAESGLFLFHDSVEGQPVYELQMKSVFEMQNSSSGVNQRCLEAQTRHDPTNLHKCLSGMTTLHHMETTIFVYNSVYDSYSLRCIWAVEAAEPHRCSAAPAWQNCSVDLNQCTTPQILALWEWSDAVVDGLVQSEAFSKPVNNGAFLHSCNTHCSLDARPPHNPLRELIIEGTSLGQALSDWWEADGSKLSGSNEQKFLRYGRQASSLFQSRVFWPCRLHTSGPPMCNPTCAALRQIETNDW